MGKNGGATPDIVIISFPAGFFKVILRMIPQLRRAVSTLWNSKKVPIILHKDISRQLRKIAQNDACFFA